MDIAIRITSYLGHVSVDSVYQDHTFSFLRLEIYFLHEPHIAG